MILNHKAKVFALCCRCGQFWRGIWHDMSKFSPTEFFESIKYYTGVRSPISICRKENGYSLAWIHHYHKNKHHLEYWYNEEDNDFVIMPYKYAVECVCDKIAATKCYKGKSFKPSDVLEHWEKKGCLATNNAKIKSFFTKVFTDYMNLGEKTVVNKKYLKQTYRDIVLK